MSTAIVPRESQDADLIEKLVIEGDLSKLSAEERVRYYYAMCKRSGLDPLSQPLLYLKLNGKLVLYFSRAATDQVAANHRLSRRIVRAEMVGNVYLVVAECSDGKRVEQSTGAVSAQGLAGDNLVNAMLKAESKAKRRAVLSFTGLSAMDESEADSIPGAVKVDLSQMHQVNRDTGEVLDAPLAAKRALTDDDPAPEKWVVKVRNLAVELADEGGEAITVPPGLTVGELRVVKEGIDAQLAALRDALPALDNPPAVQGDGLFTEKPASARGSVVGAKA